MDDSYPVRVNLRSSLEHDHCPSIRWIGVQVESGGDTQDKGGLDLLC